MTASVVKQIECTAVDRASASINLVTSAAALLVDALQTVEGGRWRACIDYEREFVLVRRADEPRPVAADSPPAVLRKRRQGRGTRT
jgi:hypothetical protein